MFNNLKSDSCVRERVELIAWGIILAHGYDMGDAMLGIDIPQLPKESTQSDAGVFIRSEAASVGERHSNRTEQKEQTFWILL